MIRQDWNRQIADFDGGASEACHLRWMQIAKPLGSLGRLEQAVEQMAGITGNPHFRPEKKALVVLCADNGVVQQGVTQTGSEVTAVLARGIAAGQLTVNQMARVAGVDVFPVDFGMQQTLDCPGLRSWPIAPGTADISRGQAMTYQQAEQAVEQGIKLALEMKDAGYHILLTGEAGIGNTTTSSAVASVLLDKAPAAVTGRGAGLSTQGLNRKVGAVQRAIDMNSPNPQDPMDVLAKVGGFDLAGLCGVFIGGAMQKMPVVVDGLISAAAALCAARLCPKARRAMLASHLSAEPACAMLLEELELQAVICADMRVGEGTGAVAAMPLLDMAYEVYHKMPTFEELAIEQYQPLQ